MNRKHDSLVSKPNHECNRCNKTFSIKEVFAMHMHKEHNGTTPIQKSCDMCLFTSHPPHVLKNHINRKHPGILKTFEYNKFHLSSKSKGVLKHHEHLTHTKKTTLMFELCEYRTFNAQYMKSHMQALCQED